MNLYLFLVLDPSALVRLSSYKRTTALGGVSQRREVPMQKEPTNKTRAGQVGRAPSLELLWALRNARSDVTSGMRHLIATAAGELGRGRPEVASDEFRTAASELARTMGMSDRQVVRLRQMCVDVGIFVQTHPGTTDLPPTYRVVRSAVGVLQT
jgi:hypothetical protein